MHENDDKTRTGEYDFRGREINNTFGLVNSLLQNMNVDFRGFHLESTPSPRGPDNQLRRWRLLRKNIQPVEADIWILCKTLRLIIGRFEGRTLVETGISLTYE